MSDPYSGLPAPRHPGQGVGPAGASLSDILTAVQHIASQIGVIGQRYMNAQGQSLASAISAPKVCKSASGRLVQVSVTAESGSATGQIIDSAVLGDTAPVIFVIPAAVGIYTANLPFTLGLLVVPGSGMTVSVSYS